MRHSSVDPYTIALNGNIGTSGGHSFLVEELSVDPCGIAPVLCPGRSSQQHPGEKRVKRKCGMNASLCHRRLSDCHRHRSGEVLRHGQSRETPGMRGSRLPDRRVLPLIRSYLTAGELNNGLFETSREGTQASPGVRAGRSVAASHRLFQTKARKRRQERKTGGVPRRRRCR